MSYNFTFIPHTQEQRARTETKNKIKYTELKLIAT